MQKGISVIVCCFNSSLRLPETIRHLAIQQIDNLIPWEIIIINNASTDSTVKTAINEWAKYNVSADFYVVNEHKEGLIFARQKGIQVANYEYLVFCDDDNWLQSDYLNYAYQLMQEIPEAGAVGGQGEIVTNGIIPGWWVKEKNSFAVGTQASQSGDITKRGYLWGSGIVTRKCVLEKVFNPRYPFLLTGRKGTLIMSGDDIEICNRIVLLGYKLFYSDKLCFKHYIPKERLTDSYLSVLYSGFKSTYDIQKKYSMAIEYCFLSPIGKIYKLCSIIYTIFRSRFSIKRINLVKTFLLFALGIKLLPDPDCLLIYKFVRHK